MIFNNFSLFTFFHILPSNRIILWPLTYGTFCNEKYENEGDTCFKLGVQCMKLQAEMINLYYRHHLYDRLLFQHNKSSEVAVWQET
jgi:hypothetical protein